MEPADPKVVYTIQTSVAGIKKMGGSWYVLPEGLWIYVALGPEPPAFELHDPINITIWRPNAQSSGTPILQRSEAPPSG